MKRPGPSDSTEETELTAFKELPIPEVTLDAIIAFWANVNESAEDHGKHSLAFVFSSRLQVQPSLTDLHESQPSFPPESHTSVPT